MDPAPFCCLEGSELHLSSPPPLLSLSVPCKPEACYPLSPRSEKKNAEAKSPPDVADTGSDARDSCVFCEPRGGFGGIKSPAICINGDLNFSDKSSHKHLPVVLEESESFSSTDSQGHTSSSTLSTSTSYTLNRRASDGSTLSGYASARWIWGNHSSRTSNKKMQIKKKKKKNEGGSVVSMILWPWKRLRDGYVSCMMSIEGRGDLSGIAHGATFATQAKYFGDLPMSKRDLVNHG